MRYALAALLVLVTVGASGQEPKPNEGTGWTQSPGENYMRACGHQKWCFSFNGGPELDAEELADRAKMLERIAALEKRVAELEKQYRYPECVTLIDKGGESACLKKGQYKLYWGARP